MLRLLASVWPYRLVRWALAGLFLYASVGKLSHPQAFAEVIADFGLIAENVLFAVSLTIIALEMIAGLALLVDLRGALSLTVCLLVVFVAVLSYGLALGLDIDCACFGPADIEVGLRGALLRDFVLLAACGYLYWSRWMRSRGPLTVRELWAKITKQNERIRSMRNVKRDRWAAVFAAVVLVGLAGCGGAKNKFEKEVDNEILAVKLARETFLGGYALVTTEELKQEIDEKKEMLIVDTMPLEDSYKKAHVPQAQQFEFPKGLMDEWDTQKTGGKSEAEFRQLLGEDPDRPIVFYCGYVKCARSHNGAMWANSLGYANVRRYPGGIFAWKGAGHPTESGE